MKFKCLRGIESMNFHKLQIKVYIEIIAFVFIGKDEIQKYVQCEVSMTVYMGRVSNQSTKLVAI